MTIEEVRDRGYNLLVTTVLFLAGIGLGSSAIPEGDAIDKVDDVGLLVVGLVAAGWYLFGGMRLRRTPVPLVLAVLALAVQVLGAFLEFGDEASFGDNIGGMLMLVPLTGIAVWQYLRPLALGARPGMADAAPGRQPA
jgi:hypothetical protein